MYSAHRHRCTHSLHSVYVYHQCPSLSLSLPLSLLSPPSLPPSQDYAKNITGKAVHGALLFLERGHFTADHLAHILKIPMSKSQARKHLATKLASLFTEDLSE